MKNLKLLIYFLVLTIISCNTNEDELQNEVVKESQIETLSRGPIPISDGSVLLNRITVYYGLGTTEAEKQVIRDTYGSNLGLFHWRVCPLNTDAEIWIITETTVDVLTPAVDPLSGNDDVDRVDLDETCN